jgi:mono/diheme cytochrome c family protein
VRGALILGVSLGLTAPALAQDAPDVAALYARCAACHTKTGAGVPGVFPPLGQDVRALATKPEGRRYLTLLINKGLMGALVVDGTIYRNIMPPQGLDDAQTAAVLNHIGTAIAKQGPAFKPFTAQEVKAYRASGGDLSPSQLALLHAKVSGQ